MAVEGFTNNLRYLNRTAIEPSQKVLQGYFEEQISSFGVDCTYFRSDFEPYPVNALLSSRYDYIYGEKDTLSYTVSAPMVIYMDYNNESILLQKFGIVNDGDGTCFISKEVFYEQMRDIIGIPYDENFVALVSANITSATTLDSMELSAPINGYMLSGITSGIYEIDNNFGNLSALYNERFVRTPKKSNPYLYQSKTYSQQIVEGSLSGILTGSFDLSGNGYLSGYVSGALSYFVAPSASSSDTNRWNEYERHGKDYYAFAPKAGDFFRLDFQDFNHLEFEISEVDDKRMASDGINPLLMNYVWRCKVNRRMPSREPVIGGIQQEEQLSPKTEIMDTSKLVSNEIFDYDKETPSKDAVNPDGKKVNLDDVYGGY